MDPERWKRVDDLLQSALARPESEREAFLHQVCSGENALEREVRSLLDDGWNGSCEQPTITVQAGSFEHAKSEMEIALGNILNPF